MLIEVPKHNPPEFYSMYYIMQRKKAASEKIDDPKAGLQLS